MKVLLTVFLFLSSSLLFAEIKIEPVYGFERTQRLFPKPTRYVTETFLGIRALYGKPIFSLEAEVTQSQSSEDFPDDNQKVKYSTQKAMLGFRTYPVQSKYFGAYFRFGARASKITMEITENGTTETDEQPINVDPYAGAGFSIVFGNNFSLNSGATLVYNKNAPSSEQFDTRYTFSFTIRASSK